jgi:hypothetical protein
MTDTPHLGLPLIEASQAQKHVTHNEALVLLDTLVQLAVSSRSLSAPPASSAEGDRYIVQAAGTGAFAGKDNQVAQYSGGGWLFYPPRTGWLAFIADEGVLVAWDGAAWVSAVSSSGDISELQNLVLLGIGAVADSANPLSAKLNNALWVAKMVGEGGDGTLRYKLSKEDASKTLSFLFQDNFSSRAEIGLTGDDDFHFKVSPDGSSWTDALVLDKTSGAARLNSGIHFAGDISPAQITSDQNDFNPTGLASASVLRLTSDASRNITGLSGGGDGRIVAIVNIGANDIVLQDASASSSAASRFAFGADVTLAAKQSAVLWYDAADQRWKLLAGPQAGGGGGGGDVPADLAIMLAELAIGLADTLNGAQFFGAAGNRFADSFDALGYVDTGAATNLDSATAGLLKPAQSGTTQTINNESTTTDFSTGFTNIDLTTALAASDVIAKVGFYSATAVTATIKIVKRNSAGNFDVVVSESFSHGGTGWELKSLSSPYTVPGSGSYYAGAYFAGSPRDVTGSVNRAFKAGDITGSGQSGFTEGSGPAIPMRVLKNVTTQDLSVASTALTAATPPISMHAVARANFVDSVTLNTDYKISVTRDGGTTWTYAALNDRYTVGALHVLESDVVNVSGQPSGSVVKWRIETANGKMVETHDIYLSWS